MFRSDAIDVQSSVLRRVQLLHEDDGNVPAGAACHIDVHFTAEESFQIFDFHTNESIAPFDGRPRVQQSTWRFEGVVTPEQTENFKLYSIVG